MVKHLTINKDQDISRILSIIKIETGHTADKFIVTEPPLSLMGNKEVLTLRLTSSWQDYLVKIDGPSFMIRELYDRFRV